MFRKPTLRLKNNMPLATPAKRVLLVDNEPNIRATLPVILQRYGYSVKAAATIAEALEAVQNDRFDILICDLNMARSGTDTLSFRLFGRSILAASSSFLPRIRVLRVP